jgi:TonB family protein
MIFIGLTVVCGVLSSLFPSTRIAPESQVGLGSCRSVQAENNGAAVEPMAIRLINPVFPQKIKKKRMHGQIALSVTIRTDGSVKDVSVVSGHPAVVAAALEAVRRWRYLPAIQNGEFVETTQEVKIDYDFGKNASPPDEQEPGSLSEPPQNLLQDIADGKLFRVGAGVAPPRALSAPDPQYTEEARRERFRGEVLLCVVVGADGEPRNIWVARTLGHGLDASSVETIKHWKFSPAVKNGEPVAAVVNVETSFNIY